MGHGAQHLDGEFSGKTVDQIEAANLEKYETPIAKQLGEPTRASYNSIKGMRRMNNSIHLITKHPHRIWGWFASYTVHHNRYPIIGTSIGPAK